MSKVKVRFREDKKPMLLYMVPNRIKRTPPTDVICITEDMVKLPPELENAVDWDLMREKVLRNTFEPLLHAIGLDWGVVVSSTKQTSLLRFS